MRRFIVLLATVSLLGLTSCIDMLEELYLNKDGSGVYNITFDMSSLFSDPMMKGMLEEMMQGEDGLNMENGLSQEMDTLIRFSDMPAEQKQQVDNPAFWDKVTMRMVMSETKKEFKSVLKLNFTSLKDIDYFYKNLDKMGNSDSAGAMGGGMSQFMPTGGLFYLQKRKLQRLPAPKPDDSMSEEEMGMVKMMFSAATYKTVYHLPGRVRKATMQNAEINGKTVAINHSFLDLLDGKAKVEGDITFKKN